MKKMNRREFLNASTKAAMAVGLAAGFSTNVLGANEKVVVGVMGAGNRGKFLATRFAGLKDVEIRYLVDPDSRLLEGCAMGVEERQGKKPQLGQDFRRMLDDKGVDAVVIATPDHWHALGTILACQAGKDVYVEKPASHSVWEGRKMIEAKERYNRVVQVGTQNRSAAHCQQAYEYIRSKDFGKVRFVRVLNSRPCTPIGRTEDEEVPEGVDYDLWLGPAKMRPFNRNHFHYNWHWFWEYSGGDIAKDGVHQVDLGRWLIGATQPKSVYSTGGSHFFHDDQETPDTQVVNWDFDGVTMVFEQTLWTPYMKKTPNQMCNSDNLLTWPFSGTRIEIYGRKQQMFLGRHGGWEVFNAKWESVRNQPGRLADNAHRDNFIECVHTRKAPNAPIEEGHLSAALCHYGNISYLVGRKLVIDPEIEGFIDDPAANSYIKRTYRDKWTVPEEV